MFGFSPGKGTQPKSRQRSQARRAPGLGYEGISGFWIVDAPSLSLSFCVDKISCFLDSWGCFFGWTHKIGSCPFLGGIFGTIPMSL